MKKGAFGKYFLYDLSLTFLRVSSPHNMEDVGQVIKGKNTYQIYMLNVEGEGS